MREPSDEGDPGFYRPEMVADANSSAQRRQAGGCRRLMAGAGCALSIETFAPVTRPQIKLRA